MSSKKFSESLNYLPARFVENKDGKFVTYRCVNPETQKMQRIKIRVNKIFKNAPNVSTAKKQVAAIVTEINSKLFAGFNPFVSLENAVKYTKVPDVVDAFLKLKAKELRPATMRSYASFSTIFLVGVILMLRASSYRISQRFLLSVFLIMFCLFVEFQRAHIIIMLNSVLSFWLV